MRNYIITCKAPNGDVKERHVEAKNHVAAVAMIKAEGLTVLLIDRDDDEAKSRSKKRLKGIFAAIAIGILLAVACVAVVWIRYGRHT